MLYNVCTLLRFVKVKTALESCFAVSHKKKTFLPLGTSLIMGAPAPKQPP